MSKGTLEGKTLYGFGDSLVYGHHMRVGMLDFLADKNKMKYTKYAINGATVIPNISTKLEGAILVPDIAKQIENASKEIPDFICFDGMTNDAYPLVANRYLGKFSDNYEGNYDTGTFIGAFENICNTIRRKYRHSKIFYICPHKMSSREREAQETLQYCVRMICKKWSIPYIDIYNKGGINTYISEMREDYSYDTNGATTGGNGTHLNEEGYKMWYAPIIEAELKKYV